MADQFSEEDWDYAGSMLAATYFVGPMLAIALLAIQIFMTFYQTSIFLNTPKQERKGRLIFILFSWAILVSGSINVALSAMEAYYQLYVGGPTGKSYTQPQLAPGAYTRASIAGDAFLAIAVTIGDILMLWRCFELWRDKKWIVVLPLLACIGAIGVYNTFLDKDKSPNCVQVSLCISLAPWAYDNTAFSRIKAIIASVSLSVAMNIMVTGLILWRLLMVWLVRRKALVGQKTYGMYSSVTAILIESAAPLAVFGICFITTTAIWLYHPPTHLRRQARVVFLREFFNWVYYSFCTLSPQMIIFRVTTGKSWRNAKDRRDEDEVFSQPIRFTGGETESRTSSLTDDV